MNTIGIEYGSFAPCEPRPAIPKSSSRSSTQMIRWTAMGLPSRRADVPMSISNSTKTLHVMQDAAKHLAMLSNSYGPSKNSPVATSIRQSFENARALYSDPLLSLRDALPALGNVSYGTLRKLIATGKIRVWRSTPRGHMKVRMSELQRFLASGDQPMGGQQ
jgi:excisionase family DNA binding protein